MSIIFVSCKKPVNSHFLEEPKVITNETLQAYNTPMSIYEIQEQITDGNLALFAEALVSNCIPFDKNIKVRLVFKNLSSYPITFTSEFYVVNGGVGSGGNLTALIHTVNGDKVLTLADVNLSSDTFNTPTSTNSTIDMNGSQRFVIDYQFPQYVISDRASKTLTKPVSGEYLIRFVYSNIKKGINNWEGIISSNQIKICLE